MIKELIINYLKDNKNGADVHALASFLHLENSEDYKILIQTLNKLEDNNLIYRDEKDNYYDLDSLNIKEGVVIIKYNGAIIDNEGQICDLNGAMHLDKVLYIKTLKGNKVVKIIKRNTNVIIGTIYKRKNNFIFWADDERLKGYKITNLKNFKLRNKLKVRCIITDYKKKEIKIESIICHEDDYRVNELSVLYKANVPMSFSEEVLKEANRLKLNIDYENRKDLTDVLTITIDGDSAKDFDDAISLDKKDDGYNLKVHIADVSYYVKEGSKIDKSAYKRGTSIYYTDKVIPMLPEKLSNDLCSLVPRKERLAITVDLDYDLKGNLIETNFYPSIIKSDYRMTYSDVNKIIDNDIDLINKYIEIYDLIKNALELSNLLKTKKEKRGAINFDDNEANIILNKEGKVIDVLKRERGISETIIEDFMIEANVAVATFMHNLDYPMIYRNHDLPKEEKIKVFFEVLNGLDYKIKGNHYDIKPIQLANCLNHFKDSDLEAVISSLLLRSMAKAIYEDTCNGHFGLALDDYCHFTSPIRRYPDLMVHRMLRKYIFKANLDDFNTDLKRMGTIANNCSETERRAIQIEREVSDVRKAEFMMDKVNKEYLGTISSIVSYGIYVQLDNTIEGLISLRYIDEEYQFDEKMMTLTLNNKIYKLGDKIKVRVLSSDRLNVNFMMVEE